MGVGIISITPEAFEVLLHLPKGEGYRLYDVPIDTIQSALLLPEGYEILGAVPDYAFRVYLIGIRSGAIPDVPPGARQPEVKPVYSREADGRVHLLHVEISTEHDILKWHPTDLP